MIAEINNKVQHWNNYAFEVKESAQLRDSIKKRY